jgi:hypothetical protein
MPRRVVAPVLLLLAATLALAAVFAVQRIESRGGPLAQPWASAAFSPNGDGEADVAQVRFTTRGPEVVTVVVVDDSGRPVRTIARDRRVDGPTNLEWDGRDDDGEPLDEGTFRIRITRSGDDRTYSPTLPTMLDVTPPVGRLDRATWEGGELRGLALLEPDARLVVVDADGTELEELRAFRPNASARSAQPEGRRIAGTVPVRFTVPVDATVVDLDSLAIVAVDRAGNRLDLLKAADAPTIRVLD